MSDQPRIFEVVPIVGGQRHPRVMIGSFEQGVGIRRSIDHAHMVMRARPEVEYVRAYMTHPDRDQPTYLGIVRRGARMLVRE